MERVGISNKFIPGVYYDDRTRSHGELEPYLRCSRALNYCKEKASLNVDHVGVVGIQQLIIGPDERMQFK